MTELFFDKKLKNTAYETEDAFMKDIFCFLDMCIVSITYMMEAEDSKDTVPVHIRQVRGCMEDVLIWTRERCREVEKNKRDYVCKKLNEAKEYIRSRTGSALNAGENFKFVELIDRLNLNEFEQFILLVSMANSYDEKYELIFTDLQGEELINPSVQLIIFLYSLFGEADDESRAGLLQRKGILPEYFLDIREETEGKPKTCSISLNRRVLSFFYGYRGLDSELEEYAEFYDMDNEPSDILIRKDLMEELKSCMAYIGEKAGMGNVINVYGKKGIGKRFFIREAAREQKKNVIFVYINRFKIKSVHEIHKFFSRIAAEAILLNALLCFVDTEEDKDDEEEDREEIDSLISLSAGKLKFFIWVSLKKDRRLIKHPLNIHSIEMPLLSVKERIFLWENFSGDYKIKEDVSLKFCANKYILSVGGIKETLMAADFIRAGQGREAISSEDIRQAVKQQSCGQMGRLATSVKAVYTWEDLIIGSEQKHMLKIICDQLKYRDVVGEEWGFYRKNPYGRGICALFYGSPGTGKTMAAQVMANELGLELYRVDMAQMASKYIGETEKNISALFKKAEHINALLFFDEADSLFAKRSEIKDSNDRNSNAETSYLLQRLEDYEGISILATNYINNIDEAFKRRIKFIVNFTFPTKDVRLRLWRASLPDAVPRDEDIDLLYYADNFELSASSIKEILTNASFLAAAEGRGLLNRHIIEAVKLNYLKYGKILSDADFGYLIY